MARTSGLGRTLGIAAVVALAVTACALIVAVIAAASGTAQRRELSQRLLPAAYGTDAMATLFTEQQASLRQYVATGRAATLGRSARPPPCCRPRRAGSARWAAVTHG